MLVEVAYAIPAHQVIIEVDVEDGCSIEQAIKSSGVLEKFPDIDLKKNKVGVFGKLAKLGDVLREKDRVEIYRPLKVDPKESRRKRAAKKDKVEQDKTRQDKVQKSTDGQDKKN